jgi:hypothetical protein
MILQMVNEYEFKGGASARQAYAMTAANCGISVGEVVAMCDQAATEILQAQRDRGER